MTYKLLKTVLKTGCQIKFKQMFPIAKRINQINVQNLKFKQ